MQKRQTAMTRTAQQKRRQPPLAALWLLFATIFAHALLPVDSPMSRTFGSAFSATTLDVSLAPVRSEASDLLVQHEAGSNTGLGGPDPTLSPAAVVAVPASAPVFARDLAAPRLAGPELPWPRAGSRPYSPRAPPLS